MSQTIQAVMGLMMISLFSFSMMQRQTISQQRILAREVEEMAGATALEMMEIIRSFPFDEAVTDGSTSGTAADLALFTYQGSTNHFSTGKACAIFGTGSADCDDLDDFHKMQTITRPFVMGTDTVYFEVDVKVEYVDNDAKRHNGRTFNKQVTVYARDVWPDGATEHLLPKPVYISRVVSYNF